jgi:hypothetical protein
MLCLLFYDIHLRSERVGEILCLATQTKADTLFNVHLMFCVGTVPYHDAQHNKIGDVGDERMKLMMTAALVLLLAMVAAIPAAHGAEPSQREIDKKAFLRAQKAATTETWTAALAVLKGIDVDKIEDVEVITYVDFSTRCVGLAEELGIDPKSDPENTKKTLAEMDLPKFFSSMFDIIKTKGISKAAKVAVEALRIQKQIPMYLKLDSTLSERYRN